MLLRHVRYLKAVAEHGSFTRAAEALHVSQPALSQQIKELEERLGAQLLDRSGRKVRPTDRGAAYLAHVRRALGALEEGARAVRDVEDLSTGSIRLGVTPSVAAYLIGPLLRSFRARYPGISLAITVSAQEQIEPALREDELDVGIGFGDLPADDIETTPLHDERPSVIMAADRVHLHGAPITAAALAQMPLALLDPTFSTRRLVDHYFRSHNLRPNITVEANSFEALGEIVRHTDLTTILPANVAANGLTIVRLQPEFEARRAALLRRRDAYCSASVRAFMSTAQELAETFTDT